VLIRIRVLILTHTLVLCSCHRILYSLLLRLRLLLLLRILTLIFIVFTCTKIYLYIHLYFILIFSKLLCTYTVYNYICLHIFDLSIYFFYLKLVISRILRRIRTLTHTLLLYTFHAHFIALELHLKLIRHLICQLHI